MEYTVQKLASLSGVTGRTLRHYDQIGLLTPSGSTQAGYRLYGPAEVDRLQIILFYRALGLPLAEIKTFLDTPGFNRAAALEAHLHELHARRAQLDRLILTVQQSIEMEQGGRNMSDKEKFECFRQQTIQENETAYGAEIRAKYGDAAMDDANARMSSLTQANYESWTALDRALRDRLEQSVKAGLSPGSEEGLALAALHRQWLSYTWDSYTKQAHLGLVQLYTEDERFTAYYDGAVPGCAAFLRLAVEAWLDLS